MEDRSRIGAGGRLVYIKYSDIFRNGGERGSCTAAPVLKCRSLHAEYLRGSYILEIQSGESKVDLHVAAYFRRSPGVGTILFQVPSKQA